MMKRRIKSSGVLSKNKSLENTYYYDNHLNNQRSKSKNKYSANLKIDEESQALNSSKFTTLTLHLKQLHNVIIKYDKKNNKNSTPLRDNTTGLDSNESKIENCITTADGIVESKPQTRSTDLRAILPKKLKASHERLVNLQQYDQYSLKVPSYYNRPGPGQYENNKNLDKLSNFSKSTSVTIACTGWKEPQHRQLDLLNPSTTQTKIDAKTQSFTKFPRPELFPVKLEHSEPPFNDGQQLHTAKAVSPI